MIIINYIKAKKRREERERERRAFLRNMHRIHRYFDRIAANGTQQKQIAAAHPQQNIVVKGIFGPPEKSAL